MVTAPSMRRKLLLIAGLVCVLFLAAGSLYTHRDYLGQRLPVPHLFYGDSSTPSPPGPERQDLDSAKGSLSKAAVVQNGRVLSAKNITTYLDDIFSRKKPQLPNLACPELNISRYETLKVTDKRRRAAKSRSNNSIRYFFAIDLRQNLPLLPRLIGSVVQAARFLGPQHCALSIVEGMSDDGTGDVLAALTPELEALGIQYFLQSSSIDTKEGDRISKLAELRNMALRPLVNQERGIVGDPSSTVIIFLNDVAACPDDILELVLQREHLDADMVCAMDWTYVSPDPTFYDVWIARGMNGDSFFEIPPDGNWGLARNLFWNAPETSERFQAKKPFQVFSCWNGAAVIAAGPLLEKEEGKRVRFRARDKEAGECSQGEPQLLCKDLWYRGHGKIAVVPAVNLEYAVESGRMIKEAKGFTGDNIHHIQDDRIEWQTEPPREVRCMEGWGNQFWQAWNKGLS